MEKGPAEQPAMAETPEFILENCLDCAFGRNLLD